MNQIISNSNLMVSEEKFIRELKSYVVKKLPRIWEEYNISDNHIDGNLIQIFDRSKRFEGISIKTVWYPSDKDYPKYLFANFIYIFLEYNDILSPKVKHSYNLRYKIVNDLTFNFNYKEVIDNYKDYFINVGFDYKTIFDYFKFGYQFHYFAEYIYQVALMIEKLVGDGKITLKGPDGNIKLYDVLLEQTKRETPGLTFEIYFESIRRARLIDTGTPSSIIISLLDVIFNIKTRKPLSYNQCFDFHILFNNVSKELSVNNFYLYEYLWFGALRDFYFGKSSKQESINNFINHLKDNNIIK